MLPPFIKTETFRFSAKIILGNKQFIIKTIKKIKHIQIPQLIGSYKKGTHLKYSDLVNVQRVKKLQIIAKDKIEVCLDGEIRTYLNPIIELIPNAISLLLPKKKS